MVGEGKEAEQRCDRRTEGPETLEIVIQRGLAWRMVRGQLDRDIEDSPTRLHGT